MVEELPPLSGRSDSCIDSPAAELGTLQRLNATTESMLHCIYINELSALLRGNILNSFLSGISHLFIVSPQKVFRNQPSCTGNKC